MSTSTLLAFAAVAGLAYVTPGPDWFVVMRHASDSRVRGWLAALGVLSGLATHLTFAAIGVSAILVTSAEAFTVLKLAGAAYLVLLGARALRDARRGPPMETETPSPASPSLRRVFGSAYLTNVLNPKAALFFVAVLPQFVDGRSPFVGQVLTLGAFDLALGLAWYSVFVLGIRAARAALGGAHARRVIDWTAGVSLIGMGGALALTDRKAA